MPAISVGISDDYASLKVGYYVFYYGYEHTTCKEHGNDSDCVCKDWCFVVIAEGQIVYRLPEDELNEIKQQAYPIERLITGIGLYLSNIGLPGQASAPSRKELLEERVANMDTDDLYSTLCRAEGVAEEEAVERIMNTDLDTVEALLKQHGYRIQGDCK